MAIANDHTRFRNRRMNPESLRSFGFAETHDGFSWSTELLAGQFRMHVFITGDGAVFSRVIDCATQEEYALFRVASAVGAFVGRVRQAHDDVLAVIAEQCFDWEVFQSEYARRIIAWVAATYGDKPEFLWPKFSDNAIFRRQDNAKWYAALLTVRASRIGLAGEDKIEILDLRAPPDEVATLVDGEMYFPGYHMNKRHWITLCLDGRLPMAEIRGRIDASYQLAAGKRKK